MPEEDLEVRRTKYASRRVRRPTAGKKVSADSEDYGCKPFTHMATKVVFYTLSLTRFTIICGKAPHKANRRAKIVHRQCLENTGFLVQRYLKG